MKKLRLLFTEDYDRNCPMCCNKSYNLKSLPKFNTVSAKKFEEILITGGEPLIYPEKLDTLFTQLKYFKKEDTKIYLYTARPTHAILYWLKQNMLDGVTITLHNERDLDVWYMFNLLYKHLIPNPLSFSMRLKIFDGLEIPKADNVWKIESNLKWVKDCPLPQNEIFMRYE